MERISSTTITSAITCKFIETLELIYRRKVFVKYKNTNCFIF